MRQEESVWTRRYCEVNVKVFEQGIGPVYFMHSIALRA
jgi:hypothetical protein